MQQEANGIIRGGDGSLRTCCSECGLAKKGTSIGQGIERMSSCSTHTGCGDGRAGRAESAASGSATFMLRMHADPISWLVWLLPARQPCGRRVCAAQPLAALLSSAVARQSVHRRTASLCLCQARCPPHMALIINYSDRIRGLCRICNVSANCHCAFLNWRLLDWKLSETCAYCCIHWYVNRIPNLLALHALCIPSFLALDFSMKSPHGNCCHNVANSRSHLALIAHRASAGCRTRMAAAGNGAGAAVAPAVIPGQGWTPTCSGHSLPAVTGLRVAVVQRQTKETKVEVR